MKQRALHILPADDRHDAAIATLTNRYIRETAVHFGCDEQTPDDVRTARNSSGDRYPWVVAEVGGGFAGFARADVWRARDAYRHTAEVALYVDGVHHRTGVGRALYARLLDELRCRAFHAVIAGIALPNEPSIALHEAMGFETVGAFREVGWKFERWHDVLFMQLALVALSTTEAPDAGAGR